MKMHLMCINFFQMIETECYKELNLFGPDGEATPDLREDLPPTPPPRGFFERLFRRRRVSCLGCCRQVLVASLILLIYRSVHLYYAGL